MTRRARFLYVFALVSLAQVPAFAQPAPQADPLSTITGYICSFARALNGPVALGVALAVITVGGLSLAIGGRRAVSTIIWGVAGTAIAVTAGTIINNIFGATACA